MVVFMGLARLSYKNRDGFEWPLIYCVLKADNRLELYSNKRTFLNGHSPRDTIDLSTAVCVCPAEYIRPSAFLILTGSAHMCLSSASVADRDEWISVLSAAVRSATLSDITKTNEESPSDALATVAADGALLRERHRGPSLCIRIWPVNVLPSTLTTSFQLHGRYWFAANNSEICLLPYATPVEALLHVSFSTIRCCGGVGQTRVFFELGRQANTGEGTLWLQAISATAAEDMKRFFSEFLSKRPDCLVDGSKRAKKSDRLKANAEKVKHGNAVTQGDNANISPLVADVAVEQPVLVQDQQETNKLAVEERSYLEIGPRKLSSLAEKKPTSSEQTFPGINDAVEQDSTNQYAAQQDKGQSDKGDFLELDFGIDANVSHRQNPTMIDTPSNIGVPHQRQTEPFQRSSQDANGSFSTPPAQMKPKQPQGVVQIDKSSVGGDYVVVCAPKSKPAVLGKQHEMTAVASTTAFADEDSAPFLADEFENDNGTITAVDLNEDQQNLRGQNSLLTASSTITSSVSPIGPIQYVSLQISSDTKPNGENAQIRSEFVKSSDSPMGKGSAKQQALGSSPQMSSVSVIYADLDFSLNNHSSLS